LAFQPLKGTDDVSNVGPVKNNANSRITSTLSEVYPIKLMRYLLNLNSRGCCSRVDIQDYVVDFVILRLFVNEVWRAASLVCGQAGLQKVRIGKFHDTEVITVTSKSEKDALYGGCIVISWRFLERYGGCMLGHCER